MSKYDVSIPRKMYWSNKIQSTTVCPECGGDLEEESHSYVLLVKKGIENAQYIIGNNGGNFCKKCPVVVLSNKVFSQSAEFFASNGTYMVAGIVDMDAIPEDKRNIPLGEEGNPTPLVNFINSDIKKISVNSNTPYNQSSKINKKKRKAEKLARKKNRKRRK